MGWLYIVWKYSKNWKKLDIGLWEVGAKRPLNWLNKWRRKNVKKLFCHGDITPFMRKSFKIRDHFFSWFFPKDSKILKCLDIGFREVGAKILLNGVRNTDTKKILLSKAKFAQNLYFLRNNLTPFKSKSFQIWDHFFPLFSPKDSKSLNVLDIRLWEDEKDV